MPDLRGVDPDDAFSTIPYEKGSTFLWYLEELVGGGAKFEPFLRAYYTAFSYKSIDSDTFKEFFLKYFATEEAVKVNNLHFYPSGSLVTGYVTLSIVSEIRPPVITAFS